MSATAPAAPALQPPAPDLAAKLAILAEAD